MPSLYGIIKDNNWCSDEEFLYGNYYKNYRILYDGEIYNSVEIKQELIEKGYKFLTYLEEEVVLNAYIEWGEKCLDKFNGIFFIAIWNVSKKVLFLARDFVGVKPVYYTKLESGIIFSNRVKNIFEKSSITHTSTYDKIFDLFVFDTINIDENMVFNNIKILLPGSFLIYDGSIKISSYKSDEESKTRDVDLNSIVNIRNIISESVIRQTIPETEVFVNLFGSNTNALIAILVSEILKEYNKKLTTVTSNESESISRIIKNYNIENVKTDIYFDINNVYKMLRIKEFPDIFNSYMYYLSLEKMKNYKNICITGDYSEYIFGSFKKKTFNKRLFLLNDEFVKNINKEFLIEDFFARRNRKSFKYNYVISNILESREKLAASFNVSMRNPIYSKELIEYIEKLNQEQMSMNMLYKAFHEFINIENTYLPRHNTPKDYGEYENMIRSEYIHVLDNPTSRIHEIIDKEKAIALNNVKIMKFIVEFNFWLKYYNVEIL